LGNYTIKVVIYRNSQSDAGVSRLRAG